MKGIIAKVLIASAFSLGLSTSTAFSQGAGQVLFLRYTNLVTTANQIRNIIVDAAFPNSPNEVTYQTSLNRGSVGDQYGQWVLGYLVPTNSGWYRIATSSDDHSALWLSTNESPGNLQMIAFTAGSSGVGTYNNAGHRCQQSPAIYLEANKSYYFEAMHKEGTGGDGLRIGWQELYPGGPTNVANTVPGIPGTFLKSAIVTPGPVSFYKSPANTTVQDGRSVTFEVHFDGDAPFTYEWFVNGVGQGPKTTYVPRSTLTLASQTIADSGKTVYVIASNQGGASSATSATGTLTVVADTVAPTLAGALGVTATPNSFQLRFSEPVSAASFTTFELLFSSGTFATSITPDAVDGSLFTVATTDPLTNGTILTVSAVADLAGNPASDLTVPIYFNEGTIRFARYDNIGGGSLNNLLPYTNYPAFPAAIEMKTMFESPDINPNLDNYGTRFRGYLRLDRTGYYYFALAPDDQGAFFISTDDQPSNARMVAGQPHSQGTRVYNQHPMTRSGPIFLESGKRYYVEALHGNGTGGDHIAVAMRYIDGIPAIEQHLTANNLTGNTLGLVGPVPDATVPISSLYLSPYLEPTSLDPSYPRDIAASECSPAQALSVVVLTGAVAPGQLQWYNAANDTPIANGTSAYLMLPAPLTNGTYYCVLANDINTVTSRTATVTVPVYSTGPSIVSAAAFDNSTVVAVTFDRVLDITTGGDPFNYTVLDPTSGAQLAGVVAVTNIAFASTPISALSGTGTRYLLTLDRPVTPPLRVVATSITDCAGRVLNPAASEYLVESWGTSINLGLKHPGNANLQATNYPISTGNMDARVPGADIWGTEDEFNFVYKQVTGDFDVRAHIPYLDRTPNVWAKAGIMVRETLTSNSRQLINATAEYLNAGEARFTLQQRVVAGAASSYWPTDPRPFVPRPLAWARLKREGNIFSGYYSTNGVGWTLVGSYDTSTNLYPATVYLGLATSGHNTNLNTIAQYRSYGNVTFPGSAINIVQQPASLTTPQGTKTRFTIVADLVNAPPNELSYQWQRSNGVGGFTNVPGATTTSLQTGFLTVDADNGSAYQVVMKIPGLSVTSAVAALTVTADTVKPKLLYAVSTNLLTVAAVFNEPMDPVAAPDAFRWSVAPGVSVTSAALNPADPTRVDIFLDPAMPMVAGTVYTVTAGSAGVGFVTDVSGNETDPAPATANFVAVTNYYAGAAAGNHPGWSGEPQAAKVLSTAGRLPIGSLTTRGFDCRMVQITNVFPNNNDAAEQVLAGTFQTGSWPDYGNQGPNFAGEPSFVETGLINYNVVNNSTNDRVQPDKPFPGIPSPTYPNPGLGNTNYITMEAVAYLKLSKGMYRFGVNSDDNFRVTAATNAAAGALVLGEYAGVGRGIQDTTFDVHVPEDGLYPFRLIWEQGGGGAGLEFWTYDLQTGLYLGINDDAGVWAYRPSGGSGIPAPTIGTSLVGGNLVICFPDPGCGTCAYTLQYKTSLAQLSWQDDAATPLVSGGRVCFTVPADQGARFYQVKIVQ